MPRMLGRVNQPWCPTCKASPGPDCPVVGDRGRRAQRHVERRAWLAEVDPWDLHVEPDEAARAAIAPPRHGMRWHFRSDPQTAL